MRDVLSRETITLGAVAHPRQRRFLGDAGDVALDVVAIGGGAELLVERRAAGAAERNAGGRARSYASCRRAPSTSLHLLTSRSVATRIASWPSLDVLESPMTDLTSGQESTGAAVRSASDLYRAVWRWHFYAGLLVLPFMITLAITGALPFLRGQMCGQLDRRLTRCSSFSASSLRSLYRSVR